MEIGLERLLSKDYKKFKGKKLGILCNQASVDKKLLHISETIINKKLGLNVTSFFGPQHGIRGEKQDNMVESKHSTDPRSGVPVFSLYSETRIPTQKMLDHFETLIIDLQDIGTRIYTFIYTMANCMSAAKKVGKKVIVLDRPNPINGTHIEGNLLESTCTSFVGQYAIPARHGMTIGEIALLFNEHFGIGCDLEVISLKGWKRNEFATTWKRDWVPPSPNIPNFLSSLVFPGMVLFEGTNVSEGRGTTKPFEWIGAPFISADDLAQEMNSKKLKGVFFRGIYFQPTYHKGKDTVCGGVHIHVTDIKAFDSFRTGVELLCTIKKMYPDDFKWKQPPYEYEHERMPIDLIAGTSKLREVVDSQQGLGAFLEKSKADAQGFKKTRRDYLLYRG